MTFLRFGEPGGFVTWGGLDYGDSSHLDHHDVPMTLDETWSALPWRDSESTIGAHH